MNAAAPFLSLSEVTRPMTLSRRGLVVGGGAAVGGALARPARAVTAFVMPAATASRSFVVLYKGAKIGTHSIIHSPATGETTVSTEIHMLVKAAFLTLFAFSHRSTETWRDGRLVSLAGETMEHGATLRVDGAATPAGFRVISKDGPFIAAAATLTSNSLWTPAVLEQATVVDAQHGGVIGISSHPLGDEQIVVGGRTVKARSHSLITPYLAGTIWYDEQDLWVQGAFEHDGSHIQYQLLT
jgi:Family of unknown function (DUF6134)